MGKRSIQSAAVRLFVESCPRWTSCVFGAGGGCGMAHAPSSSWAGRRGLLERAVGPGRRDRAWLETDTNLALLRDTPRFEALLGVMH